MNESKGIEPNPKAKNAKWDHVKKVKRLSSTVFIVLDQIHDIILFISLIYLKEFWFASIFFLVDLLPAAFIIWHKYK